MTLKYFQLLLTKIPISFDNRSHLRAWIAPSPSGRRQSHARPSSDRASHAACQRDSSLLLTELVWPTGSLRSSSPPPPALPSLPQKSACKKVSPFSSMISLIGSFIILLSHLVRTLTFPTPSSDCGLTISLMGTRTRRMAMEKLLVWGRVSMGTTRSGRKGSPLYT